MINATLLKKETLLSLMMGNPSFILTVAKASEWSEVLDFFNTENIQYTEEQIQYIKQNLWKNEPTDQV